MPKNKRNEFGGAGSGNFGHAGRKGEVGGSSSEGGGTIAGHKTKAGWQNGKRLENKIVWLDGPVEADDEKIWQVWVGKEKRYWGTFDGKNYYKDTSAQAEHSVPVGEVVIFRSGKHTTKSGQTVEYSDNDLDQMVETYSSEPDQQPAFIVGHSSEYPVKTAIPAFGRITGGLKRIGHDLIAVGSEFAEKLAEWVREGYYSERSAEIGVDENGKHKVYGVAMLGAIPPAISGMPSATNALGNPAFAFSGKDSKVNEFADAIDDDGSLSDALDRVEEAMTQDTIKDMTESCAKFISTIEDAFTGDIDPPTVRQRVCSAINDLCYELNYSSDMHFTANTKIENIEEHIENEMSQFKTRVLEFASKIFGKQITETQSRKESKVDGQKEQDYQTKIAEQQKKLDEFAAAQKAADEKAAEAKLRNSVKEFCSKNGLNTKRSEELKVEDNLFIAAKARGMKEFSEADNKEAYTELSGLYVALKSVPPTGEMKEFSDKLPDAKTIPTVYKQAEEYQKKNPQEFAGLSPEQAKRKAMLAVL